MTTAPTDNSLSTEEREWPSDKLATVLNTREDLLVECAAVKGIAIDKMRELFKEHPRMQLCNFAKSLVLNQTDDPYLSYVEWLRDVATKLQVESIGDLDARLAPFQPNKTLGRIEGTANRPLYYLADSEMRKGRYPWREVRVSTVRIVLDRFMFLVNSVQQQFYRRSDVGVLKYVENRVLFGRRKGRGNIHSEVLIQPTAHVVGVAVSTNAEYVGIRRAEWPSSSVDWAIQRLPTSSGKPPEGAGEHLQRRRRGARRNRWEQIIERITNIVKEQERIGIPVLIALNAPLGWPSNMTDALAEHEAGDSLASMKTDTKPTDAERWEELNFGYWERGDERRWRAERNRFFRRETEQVVRKVEQKGHFGPAGLDVGADKSARTAHQALRLLNIVRTRSRSEIPVVTDECGPITRTSAIEVYTSWPRTPADEPHKRNSQVSPDGLAAIAGAEAVAFLEGRSDCPREHCVSDETARKEGWIWFGRGKAGSLIGPDLHSQQ